MSLHRFSALKPGGQKRLQCDPGQYALGGQVAVLRENGGHALTALGRSYALTGQPATLRWNSRKLVALSGAYTLTGTAASLFKNTPPQGLFISPTGNDSTGDGTIGNPWRTLSKGMAEVSAGGRLVLRGGTYRLTSDFTWTKSGTSGSRITVASHTGEVAVLDTSIADFQTPNIGRWALHDAATETYRSAAGYTEAGLWTGNIVIGSETWSDGTLWSDGTGWNGGVWYKLLRYPTLTALMSTTYTWLESGEYYSGPGYVLHSDGRFYIRIQNLQSPRSAGVPSAAPANALIRNLPPSASGFNPNTYVLHFTKVQDAFTVAADNVTFERLALHNGDRGFVMGGRSNLTFQNCRIWGQRINFRWGEGNNGIQVLGCDADSTYPPWSSWNEIKGDDHAGMRISFATIDAENDNFLIQDNHIRSAFDGITSVRTTTDNFRVLHNTFDFVFDDAVQWTGGTTNFEFAYNFVSGPGPGYQGGTDDATASKWFHHNVLDTRRDEFGWRIGMEANNGGGTAWRRSHRAFPQHSADSNTPVKIYNNTILIEENIANTGAAIQRVGFKTAGLHEAYNNIVLQYDDREYVRNVSIGATDQILDYNVMWKVNGGSFQLMNDWPGGDYNSLAAWKASQGFQDSKAVYAPGFENSSKQINPQLANPDARDFRPTNNDAKTGAKNLASTGWPGATNEPYFGAVDPNASTGLGNVGARGTTGP